MKKKILVIGSAAALVMLMLVQLGLNKAKIDDKKNTVTASAGFMVTVKPVAKTIQGDKLTLTGVTTPKQEVTLQAETAGQVAALRFSIGEYVRKGQLLVLLDDTLAALSVETARLKLSKLQDEFAKAKNLYAGKATTENQLRDAKFEYESARVALAIAEKQLQHSRITAPQSGYVVAKFIERGTFVNPGTALVTIIDIAELKITVNAAEKEAYLLRVGQPVTITSTVYPGVTFTGKVSFVTEQGDKIHNYPVEIVMANPHAHPLKAGTFVSADFTFPTNSPSLVIARDALVGSIKNASVYVVDNGKAQLRTITVGRDLGNALEILNGLAEGERVIVTGQINLSNGTPVSIIQ